jgi:hypothetical protein
MYDHAMVVENLRNIEWALNQILKRSSAIESSDDFLKDDAGIEKLKLWFDHAKPQRAQS